MKLSRTEKLWLLSVVVFYILYNLPFVPAYGNAAGTLIHAVITLVPLWVFVYFGMVKVFREQPLRKDKEESND